MPETYVRPISRSSPTRSTRRSRADAWWAPRCLRHSFCAARRRSWPRSTANCSTRSDGGASSWSSTSSAIGSSSTPCSPAGWVWPWPAPSHGHNGPRRSTSVPSTSRRAESLLDRARARPVARSTPGRATADWLPRRDLGVELRYRDATRMGKIYLAAGRRGAADRGLGRAGPGRRRPCVDARGMARAHRQIQRGAQEPTAQPGVRGRHRQCLFGRDPVGGAAGAVSQAVVTGRG